MELTVIPHGDVQYFLLAQGLVSFAFAVLLGGFTAILFAFIPKEKRKGLLASLLIGVVATLWGCVEGVWSFVARSAPEIALRGDKLTVDGTTITLGPGTDLLLSGHENPMPATDREPGYFRFPGAGGFPPLFTGGPNLTIRSKDGSVTIQPLMYGPSGYLGDRGSRELAKLFETLVAVSQPDEVRDWVKSNIGPTLSGPTPPPPSSTGLVVGSVITILFLGGAFGLVVSRRNKPTKKRPTT